MKLTKPILKQIIKESLEDEYKEKLLMLFKYNSHQQAIELSKQVDMEDFLVGANLEGEDLEGANLTGAILTGADLRGANLTGANLYNAVLSNIKHDKDTVWPEGFTP